MVTGVAALGCLEQRVGDGAVGRPRPRGELTDPVALREADRALVKRDVALLRTILGRCFTPELAATHALPHILRMYQPLLAHRARDVTAQS